MQKTPIQWTDFSASLLKYRDADGKSVHACVKISPGCAHCYAETMAGRWEPGRRFTLPMTNDTTPFFDEQEARKILRSRSIARKMMFVDDMTDLFGDWVPDGIVDRHYAIFDNRDDVTFQILTKRSKRMRTYHSEVGRLDDRELSVRFERTMGWPVPNVWLGVSVEDQQRADERIPDLLATPAATRFLSCEPLLGPIILPSLGFTGPDTMVDWVIVGGESGCNARPCDIEWIRSIVKQCRAAGVPVFVKQLGSHPVVDPDTNPDLRQVALTVRLLEALKHPKGGDPAEWPADLRVREFPAVAGRGERHCRVCGCTDADCSACVERTGQPCSWVEADLCSACVAPAGRRRLASKGSR